MAELTVKIAEELIFACAFYMMVKRFLYWDKHNIRRVLVFMTALCVTTGLQAAMKLSFLVSFPMILATWMILVKGNFLNRLIDTAIIYFMLIIIQFVFVYIQSFFGEVGKDDVGYNLIINCFLVLTVFMMVRIPAVKWIPRIYSRFSVKKKLLMLTFLIFSAFLAGVGLVIQTKIEKRAAIVGVVILIDLFGILYSYFALLLEIDKSERIREHASMQEQIIASQKQYYEAIIEKEKELRKFRHDIGSQLGILKYLFEKDDRAEFAVQLNRLLETHELTGMQRIYTGNELIDAIINAEYAGHAQSGIAMKVKGKIKDISQLDKYDLCALISNSLRNALEAAEGYEGDRQINISFLEHNGTLHYMIDNPSTPERFSCLENRSTAKSDAQNHGYGVESIRNAVSRMGGSLEYHYDEGRVRLDVMI